MKTLFIPASSKLKINPLKIKSLLKELPKNLILAYSIQYKDLAEELKKIISKEYNIEKFVQVLGCSKLKFSKKVQAILLISDGKFHAIALAKQTNIPVYILTGNKLEKISKEEIKILEKKQKVSYLKFLNADKVGILVSTKPGQQNLQKALEFKKKTKKQSYLFICNNVNVSEFENFGLDSWVNTACPRLDMESSSIINIDKINN